MEAVEAAALTNVFFFLFYSGDFVHYWMRDLIDLTSGVLDALHRAWQEGAN